MSGLTLKRLIVIVISQALGFLTTVLIIGPGFELLNTLNIAAAEGITIGVYGFEYFLVTAVPIGVVFMIWMDKFVDTGILPD